METVKPVTFQKRIGSIVYEVGIYFNQNTTETLSDKTLRLIKYNIENTYENNEVAV
jgi:hypothetical protein